MLKVSVEELGDLSGFVYNVRSKRLIAGHQKQKVIPENSKIVIEVNHKSPTKCCTVAEGYVLVGEERFKYREVDADEDWETVAMLASNKHSGEWDKPLLKVMLPNVKDVKLAGFSAIELKEFEIELPELDPVLGGHDDDDDSEDNDSSAAGGTDDGSDSTSGLYSSRVTSPIYKITGEKPKTSELYDLSKTQELLNEIASKKLPEDVKLFLQFATYRHIVFNYENIAEYYAHCPSETQDLIENSALVIIDFKKAIEKGFVLLSDEVSNSYLEDQKQ